MADPSFNEEELAKAAMACGSMLDACEDEEFQEITIEFRAQAVRYRDRLVELGIGPKAACLSAATVVLGMFMPDDEDENQ